MSNEERKKLLKEIEEIRTHIEALHPGIYETRAGRDTENTRAELTTLRKYLARDMELLHTDNCE